jgi:hypothetical protein
MDLAWWWFRSMVKRSSKVALRSMSYLPSGKVKGCWYAVQKCEPKKDKRPYLMIE